MHPILTHLAWQVHISPPTGLVAETMGSAGTGIPDAVSVRSVVVRARPVMRVFQRQGNTVPQCEGGHDCGSRVQQGASG
jgi:hypothetical protein